MTNTCRARSLIVALTMLAAACGGGRTLQNRESATMLEVENQSTLDMTIYAISASGVRDRMGTVTALNTARFEIPSHLATALDLRFAADPVGSSRTAFSERVTLIPGETVVLQIPPAAGRF